MNKLVRKEDVIAVAEEFTFTDEVQRKQYMCFLEYCLNVAPTTYDLDEVVKKLEEKAFIDFDEYYTDCGEMLISFSDATEIIKRGGINV